jgi:UDP-glucose 4-epimerase
MNPPRALVTGAAGFIGSHLADACLGLGMEVVGVDNLSGGFRYNVGDGVRFIEGDLRQQDFVDRLWSEAGPFDYVYHFAAYAAEGLSHHIRCFNYENNLVASTRLINAAVHHQARHFTFASSIAVYGAGQVPLSEETQPQPEDPYGIAKYAIELDIAAAARVFGMPYTIFRPHNVYGERQHIGDRYRNVIGIFMNQCLRGEPMTILGDGHQTRAFTYIGDIVQALAQAPRIPACTNRVFNIGADEPTRVLDLAHEVARALGMDPRITHFPARPEVVHAFADHARVRAAFGPLPSTSLREGLSRMAAWARKRGPVEPSRFGAVELPEKLPPIWK